MSKWAGIKSIKELRCVYTPTGNPLPGEIVPCLVCAKPFLMRKYSGAPDQICPECFQTYLDCAKIVCVQCKVVIARVSPEVLDTGFIIRPRSIMHTNRCNVCSPGLDYSTVLEIDKWEQLVGRNKSTIVAVRFGLERTNEDIIEP